MALAHRGGGDASAGWIPPVPATVSLFSSVTASSFPRQASSYATVPSSIAGLCRGRSISKEGACPDQRLPGQRYSSLAHPSSLMPRGSARDRDLRERGLLRTLLASQLHALLSLPTFQLPNLLHVASKHVGPQPSAARGHPGRVEARQEAARVGREGPGQASRPAREPGYVRRPLLLLRFVSSVDCQRACRRRNAPSVGEA